MRSVLQILDELEAEIQKSIDAMGPTKGMTTGDLGEFHAPISTLHNLRRWLEMVREASLTDAETKVAAHLLQLASNQFANHGCNDLDLVREVGLTPEESHQLRLSVAEWAADPGAPEEEPDDHMTFDWLVMDYIAARVSR